MRLGKTRLRRIGIARRRVHADAGPRPGKMGDHQSGRYRLAPGRHGDGIFVSPGSRSLMIGPPEVHPVEQGEPAVPDVGEEPVRGAERRPLASRRVRARSHYALNWSPRHFRAAPSPFSAVISLNSSPSGVLAAYSIDTTSTPTLTAFRKPMASAPRLIESLVL